MRIHLAENLKTSFRAMLFYTIVTGVLFPLLVTALAKTLFPAEAAGSLVVREGKILGSTLIAVKHTNPRYFQYRPSAADFATVASGASNASPASQGFVDGVRKRQAEWGEGVPADLVTASGSGLDPDISPEAARFQIARVAKSRGLGPAELERLRRIVESQVVPRTFGVLGQTRVNVLKLNLSLDDAFPPR